MLKTIVLLLQFFLLSTFTSAVRRDLSGGLQPPVPIPDIFQWNDRKENQNRVDALLKWAEAKEDKDEAGASLQQDQNIGVFLEEARANVKAEEEADQMRLRAWRRKLKHRAEKEKIHEAATRRHKQETIRMQVALVHNHDTSSQHKVNVEEIMKDHSSSNILESTQRVAHSIKAAARTLLEERKNTKKTVPSKSSTRKLLQTASSVSLDGLGSKKSTKCIMCLYLMESIEREIGFPQRDFYSDAYPNYASRWTQGYPGPAAYFRGYAGSTPVPPGQYNPIPGPGYSYLEVGAEASQKGGPIPLWNNVNDYSVTVNDDENLRQRAINEYNADAKATQNWVRKQFEPRFKTLEEMYESNSLAEQGVPREQRTYLEDGPPPGVLEAEKEKLKMAREVQRKLAGQSFLSLSSTLRGRSAGILQPSLLEIGAKSQSKTAFVGGVAAAMGLTVCRPGKKYCRPRLKQPGRRQLERRIRMQSINAEYHELESLMGRALEGIMMDMPPDFLPAAEELKKKLWEVSQMYIHDYDDNEICSDIALCDTKLLKIPRAPYIWPWFPYP